MNKAMVALLPLGLAACSAGNDVPAGEKAVARFHAMLDAGQSTDIYRQSSSDMKVAATEEKLTALLDAVHRKLGTVKKSEQKGWNDQFNPGGHFLTMNYATSFQRGDAVETFVFKVTDDKAALAGYNVNSEALIVN